MNNNWTIADSIQTTLQEIIRGKKPSSVWIICDKNTRQFCLPLLGISASDKYQLITISQGRVSNPRIWIIASKYGN